MRRFPPMEEMRPAPRKSRLAAVDKLYVAVLDSSYEYQPYLCRAHAQWMAPLERMQYVDGIELYSMAQFRAPCGIQTLQLKPEPYGLVNPSGHQVYEAMKVLLARTDARNILFIADFAWMNLSRIEAVFDSFRRNGRDVSAVGSCIEQRFYFQMFTAASGMFITRAAIQKLLELKWDVVLRIGLNADEILGHFLDQLGVHPRWQAVQALLGRPFRNQTDGFAQLMGEPAAPLGRCEHPPTMSNVSGVGAVCRDWTTAWSDLAVWAAVEERDAAGKNWLWEDAGGAPRVTVLMERGARRAELAFYWDKRYPQLCDQRIR